MESNIPEQNVPLKETSHTKKSFLPWILVILLIGVGVWLFFKRSHSQTETSLVASSSPYISNEENFSLEDKSAIGKFIENQIHTLSPVEASSGTKFSVRSAQYKGNGEFLVVYSDSFSTYTARGIFQLPEPKKINIVSFDIISEVSSVVSEEKQKVVEAYIKENISTLSPEKEVLGGKFYTTRLVFEKNNTLHVEYEDGHNAYVAMVHFALEENNQVKILDWTIVSPK